MESKSVMTDKTAATARDRWMRKPKRSRGRAYWALLGVTLGVMLGCNDLLTVDIPGAVFEEDLHDPRLATTLALTAASEFECAFKAHVSTTTLWADEMESAGGGRDLEVMSQRQDFAIIFGDVPGCNGLTAHWTPLHIARTQGENAAEILGGFSTAAVPNRDFLVGKALVHAAYTYVFLGESYCVVAFDGGPMETREDAWRRAEAQFTSGMDLLATVTTGTDAAEAADLLNFARVGRARARLNLGDNPAGVVEDASLVPPDFRRETYSSTADARLDNPLVTSNTVVAGGSYTVHPRFRNLTAVDSATSATIEDPRVPLLHVGLGAGQDGVADYWANLKYTERDDPWRIADWREAQLMIAEVQGGQTAVDIINTLRDTYDLKHFASVDPVEIRDQVREERRRELFLDGARMGDKLRWDEPWDTGTSEHGGTYGPWTCMPLPEAEYLNNPNFPAGFLNTP